MANQKNGELTQTKKAMEYVYCIVNERELFEVIKTLIEANLRQNDFQSLHFTITGYQMLSLLTEHV